MTKTTAFLLLIGALAASAAPPSAPGFSVESTPAGASLSIDGTAVGTTPWAGWTTPGRHALLLELAGHVPVKKTVQIKAGVQNTEKITLQAELVSVTVRSVPPKAEVKVDGATVGKAPWVGKLPVGAHTLVVSLDGFEPDTSSIELESRARPLVKDVRLALSPATLKLVSSPAGAHVFVDEVKLGTTPFNGPVQVGTHVIAVRLPGYKEASEGVKAAVGVTIERSFTLQVLPQEVTVETLPPGATVAIDGTPGASPSPLKVQLMPGKHKVLARKDGYDASDVDYDLPPGLGASWKIELRESQAARAAQLPPPPPPPPANIGGDLPPPPPPPPPVPQADPQTELRAKSAMLADPKVGKVEKSRVLDQLAVTNGDLTQLIALVLPAELRGELCMQWQNRVYPARLRVRAVDAFGDEVPSVVVAHGHDLGATPFDGQVPSCITRVTVRSVGEGDVLEKEVGNLDTHSTNKLDFDFKGRPARVVLGLYGDTAINTAPGGDPHLGGGVRLDYWGRVFHLSFGLKAMTQYREILQTPVVPGADLFLGLGYGAPARTDAGARFHFAFEVGMWNVVNPTGRLTLTLNIADRVFLTASGDLHLDLPSLLSQRSSGGSIALDRLLFPGLCAGLGIGF